MNEQFRAAVSDFLRARCNQRESVSFLRSHLRDEGWRRLGSSISQFESVLEDAGFKLERVYTKMPATREDGLPQHPWVRPNLRMTWVHLPDWKEAK